MKGQRYESFAIIFVGGILVNSFFIAPQKKN